MIPLPERFSVFVPGRPVPQGSKTAFINKKTGRPVIVDKDMRLPEWRMKVTAYCRDAMNSPVPGGIATIPSGTPVGVRIDFVMDRPQAHYGTGKNADKVKPSAPKYPASMPDLDKLLRAIFDALTDAQVWSDDGQVVWCQTAKYYAGADWPSGQGVHITLGVMR